MRSIRSGIAISLACLGVANANTWVGPGGAGGVGAWHDAANWSAGVVPNDPAADVFVDGGKAAASVVTLTQYAAVHDLTLDAGDTLRLEYGALDVAGNLTLNGTLDFGPTLFGTVTFNGPNDKSVSGNGSVRFNPDSGTSALYNNNGGGKVTLGNGVTLAAAAGGSVTGWFESGMTVNAGSGTLALVGLDAVRRFTNTGVVSLANNATLRVKDFTNAGTLNLTDAALSLEGKLTLADLGTINRYGTRRTEILGTFDNTNTTLALDDDTGSYDLRGTVKGGTLTTSGAARLVVQGGYNATIDGLTVAAASRLELDPGATLYVTNGLTLNGTLATRGEFSGATVFVAGTGDQSITGTGAIEFDGLSSGLVNNGSGKLTVGGGLTLTTGSASISGYIDYDVPTTVESGGLSLSGASDDRRFTTRNTITTAAGTAVYLKHFTNAGTIVVNDAYLSLTDTFKTADLGAIVQTGASHVSINGTLDNTDATLSLNDTTGSFELGGGGTIRNGTIATSGNAQLIADYTQGGTLDNVTIAPGANVVVRGGLVQIYNDLIVNGTLRLKKEAFQSNLIFLNAEARSLAGTGTLVFDGLNYLINNNLGKLTIESGVNIETPDGGYFSGHIESKTDLSVSDGKFLHFNSPNADYPFINAGTILATNGARVELSRVVNTGVISLTDARLDLRDTIRTADLGVVQRDAASVISILGRLDNAGATFALSPAGSVTELQGTIAGGTIAGGGGSLVVTVGAVGVLDNVTVAAGADVGVDGYGILQILGDLVLNGTIRADNTTLASVPTSITFMAGGPKAVTGTGTIRLSSPIYASISNGNTGETTLGPGVHVDTTGRGFFQGHFDNQADVRVRGGDARLELYGGGPDQPFTNNAIITIDDNGTLVINAHVVNNGAYDLRSGRIILPYTLPENSPATAVRDALAASAPTNFSTGPYQSSRAGNGIGLGYADNGSAVTIFFALLGDADNDGIVNFDDFVTLQSNFGLTPAQFAQGDFDFNGVIDFNDFVLLQSNFGKNINGSRTVVSREQVAAVTAFGITHAVPEPAVAVLAAASLAMLRRRRRPIPTPGTPGEG